MSIHPSLKSGSKSKKHKSVLNRLERLFHLLKKDEWNEEKSVFGLPKVKIVKFKIKKEKAEKAAEGVEGEAAATGVSDKAAGEKKAEATAPVKDTEKKDK